MDRRDRKKLGLALVTLLVVMAALMNAVWVDESYPSIGGDIAGGLARLFGSDGESVPANGDARQPNEALIAVYEEESSSPAEEVESNASVENVEQSPSIEEVESSPASALVETAQFQWSGGSILANRRVLTFYGHPYDARMGILGELSDDDLIAALFNRAAMYEEFSDRPVQPAIHIISTVAQDNPGSDGLYRARTDPDLIQYYADLAAQNDMLLFVDVQVGHSSVQDEIEAVMPFLTQSHVHLALDPEFDMWDGSVPGDVIGGMSADEINYAQGVLSQIVAEQGGPNKILIVHQFTPNMIGDKWSIVDDPNVDLVVDMDGFGDWDLKVKHYNMFVRDELIEYGGIKLFFTQDTPLMSPEDVMSLEPVPDVIIYQ